MKRMLGLAAALGFMLTGWTGVASADPWKDESGHGRRGGWERGSDFPGRDHGWGRERRFEPREFRGRGYGYYREGRPRAYRRAYPVYGYSYRPSRRVYPRYGYSRPYRRIRYGYGPRYYGYGGYRPARGIYIRF